MRLNCSVFLFLTTMFSISSCAVSPGNSSSSTSSTVIEVPEGWKIKWQDEFDGDEIDTNYWSYQEGGSGWGNNELQYYTNGDNAYVENGHLVISVDKETRGNNQYTSSRLRTVGKAFTTYGRIEARLALPVKYGMWPAFWMMPEPTTPYGGWASSGEIDIMERMVMNDYTTSAALHYGNAGRSTYKTSERIFRDSTTDEFHIYYIEWEERAIRWYVDDDEDPFLTVTNATWWTAATDDNANAPFDVDFHIILNVAVGGNVPTPLSDFEHDEMLVDYVRIYEKDE